MLGSAPISPRAAHHSFQGRIYGRMSRGARQDSRVKGALLCRLPPLPLRVSLPALISPPAFCVLEHDNHQPPQLRLQGSRNCMSTDALPKIVTAAGIPFSLPSPADHLVSSSSGLFLGTNTDFSWVANAKG